MLKKLIVASIVAAFASLTPALAQTPAANPPAAAEPIKPPRRPSLRSRRPRLTKSTSTRNMWPRRPRRRPKPRTPTPRRRTATRSNEGYRVAGITDLVTSTLSRSLQGRRPRYAKKRFCRKFSCGRERPGTMNGFILPANRTAALDAICPSRAIGPCGSCA